MASKLLLAVAAAAALGQSAAVTVQMEDFRRTVKSKKEILSSMTGDEALVRVMKIPEVHERPGMVELLGHHLKHHLKANRSAHGHHRHHHKKIKDDPQGYAALAGARDMLNTMMSDAQAKLDVEAATCDKYHHETLSELERMRMDVATYNAQAADARGLVLKAQATIGFTEQELPEVSAELSEHESKCEEEERSIGEQIGIAADDLNVTGQILSVIGDCSAAAQSFLIQCGHCSAGDRGYVMMQNDVLQPLINRLKSAASKAYVQNHLGQLFDQMSDREEPQQLTQEAVRHQTKIMRSAALGLRGQHHQRKHFQELEDSPDFNESEVPSIATPLECAPTTKCVLGSGSCAKIRDRFLYIQAGIQDMFDKLKGDLKENSDTCEEVRQEKKAQIADLTDQQRTAQTQLASATKDQVSSESSSNTISLQHNTLKSEYSKTMKECCDEQNELKSELCALEKIRGELYKMKGQDVFITDCEVSDFVAGQCSETCGGGVLEKTRSILVHPVNGMPCPPLTLKDTCNTQPCPIDCALGDWEGWSGCSAQCGGGVRERTRRVIRQPQYDGAPCEDTEETESCNAQSCNADCELGEWEDWEGCTQACLGGTQRRLRPVQRPSTGTGSCPEPESEQRLEFRACNTESCKRFYGSDSYLTCNSKVDLLVLMDGSGSLMEYGWSQSKKFVSNLIAHLNGTAGVQVAVQVFSGPSDWTGYSKCIGYGAAPDLKNDCKIDWISHFTNDTKTLSDKVKTLAFPDSTTLTSVALAEAQAELVYGRDDAMPVVVVVTDGQPMSHERTLAAANRLKEKARVIWVPVGYYAPYDLVEELASLPKKENMVKIQSFYLMGFSWYVNQVIVRSCPTV